MGSVEEAPPEFEFRILDFGLTSGDDQRLTILTEEVDWDCPRERTPRNICMLYDILHILYYIFYIKFEVMTGD